MAADLFGIRFQESKRSLCRNEVLRCWPSRIRQLIAGIFEQVGLLWFDAGAEQLFASSRGKLAQTSNHPCL
jgi:hypothetical protein